MQGREPPTVTDGREYEASSLEVGGGLPRYHDWLMSFFTPHLHGRVLELGAGLGTVSARYVDRVDRSVLVEPATNLHAKLAARFASHPKVRTTCSFLDDVVGKSVGDWRVEPGSFDTAIMVNVLEHIEDDLSTAKTLYSLLKPGGVLLIFVPALPILYGELDRGVGHHRRYTKTSLGRVLERAGFEPASMRYFDLLGALPWFVTGRVLGRSSVGDGSAKVYDRFVIPACRLVDRLTGPRVGKNLICVARRPSLD